MTSGLASGWTMLAQGRPADAAAIAAELSRQDPRDIRPVMLRVEADLSSTGSDAALQDYERWLGARRIEEPGLLRRIAFSLLEKISGERQNPSARFEALRLLAAEGDSAAQNSLAQAAEGGGNAEATALAATGDRRAVARVIDELKQGAGNRLNLLASLGDSKDPSAFPVLADELRNDRPELRGAAATALGKLGDPRAITSLRALSLDPSPFVRFQAAAALYRLGDTTARAVIDPMTTSDSALDRLAAVQALASTPDARWLNLVEQLTRATEPDVRLRAAQLIAPYQPQTARDVLDGLARDPSLAIREEASRVAAETEPADLTRLREFLHSGDRLTRVRAAGRILELCR